MQRRCRGCRNKALQATKESTCHASENARAAEWLQDALCKTTAGRLVAGVHENQDLPSGKEDSSLLKMVSAANLRVLSRDANTSKSCA